MEKIGNNMTEYVITEEQKKKIKEINHAFGVMKKYQFTYVADDWYHTLRYHEDDTVTMSIIVNYLEQYDEVNDWQNVQTIKVDGMQNIDYTISIAQITKEKCLLHKYSCGCTSPYFDISENKYD